MNYVLGIALIVTLAIPWIEGLVNVIIALWPSDSSRNTAAMPLRLFLGVVELIVAILSMNAIHHMRWVS